MKVLSTRFVVDPEISIRVEQADQQRKYGVLYEQKRREVEGVRQHRDEVALNPLPLPDSLRRRVE